MFRRDGITFIVVGSEKVTGSSLTLHLNALVDSSRTAKIDARGFFCDRAGDPRGQRAA